MFENRGFLCRHVFKILEFLGGSVQYHCLKTILGQYVLKRWTRDVRPSIDKLKSTISVGTEETTQAQRYQQICAVTVQLSTRVCADPEASQVFLHGVLEAGKKAEELLLSKGIHTDTSSVTPSKSSKAAVVGESSTRVNSTAPKFKERPNPIKSKKRLKSDYEKARQRQKFLIGRKKQKRDDEALKGKVATD
ncbi:putative FHY3/FAR1 family protein [Medicago truncatula]|uniref:Protein FAR1-RELATED SEQUENCE n=1 Tax=Medicago truncatula TaxID=3880 RepID=A0A396ITE2_MEDTR|nr:putative FHY3/FAR1 family protein [Medicago truncatula]